MLVSKCYYFLLAFTPALFNASRISKPIGLLVSFSAELLSLRRRPSSVRQSVNNLRVFSQKPLHGSRPNFVEKYIFAISPDRCFFFFFKNFDYVFFFFFRFR